MSMFTSKFEMISSLDVLRRGSICRLSAPLPVIWVSVSLPSRMHIASYLPRAIFVQCRVGATTLASFRMHRLCLRLRRDIDRDTVSVGPSAHNADGRTERFDTLSPSALEAARLWQSALRATLTSEDEREIFSPAPAQGTARLRRAIAHHLRGTRGMNVDPDNIVIGAGAQLLDTMLVQLLGADKVYAVEDPGYLRLTRIYQAMGCKVRHIPLDDEGVDLSALQKTGTDVLHLMPSHQYPTGLVTSIARRYAPAELGRRADQVGISSKMTLIVSFALLVSRFPRSRRSMPPSRLSTPTRFRRACHRRCV